MDSTDQAENLEALATLRMLREHVDVTELSVEDREALSEWVDRVEESADRLEPKVISSGGLTAAAMFYDPGSEGLEPHLIPVALAIRAFDSAISEGLPGAEHLAEEFFRDCGLEEASIRQMLLRMVARAPLPDVESLN